MSESTIDPRSTTTGTGEPEDPVGRVPWPRRVVTRHPSESYVVLAIALSWAWWIPLAMGSNATEPGVGWPTHLPGLLGPALAAVAVTAVVDGRPGLADLARRSLRWRVGWWWLTVGAVTAAGAVGLAISGVDDVGDLTRYNGISASLGAAPTVVVALLVNGFGEEAGWRGFLADRLLARRGLIRTSLLVTVAWAVWHVPLFFLVGSFDEFSPAMVVGWTLGLTAGSLVLTWLHRGAHRSILVVAVWHTAFNLVSGATPAGEGTPGVIASTAVMVAAVAIAVSELAGRPGRPTGGSDGVGAGSAD